MISVWGWDVARDMAEDDYVATRHSRARRIQELEWSLAGARMDAAECAAHAATLVRMGDWSGGGRVYRHAHRCYDEAQEFVVRLRRLRST